MKLIDIGDVSARTGIPASTLRYYDEIGLITSAARHGLRRQFSPDVLVQLGLVAMGKTAGFSLEDITRIFGRDGAPVLPRDELRRKADEVDQTIRDLTALRDTLRHVAECPAPSHLECPTFQRLLRLAGRRASRAHVRRRGAIRPVKG